jgi:hypothetical protein
MTVEQNNYLREERMNIKALAFGLLLAPAPAFGANLDGKWTGSLDSPNGPVQLSYAFKADGKSLTGSTTGLDGSSVALKNGTIRGDKITFSIDLDLGGGPTTFMYTGVGAPGEIKLYTEFMGMPIDFTLKKAP